MSRRDKGSLPTDFDPASHPIISRHWFGVEPLHPIGPITATLVASPRRQRAAEHLRKIGEHAVEVCTGLDFGQGLKDRARTEVVQLDPETVRRLDGDKFWPAPLREVGP